MRRSASRKRSRLGAIAALAAIVWLSCTVTGLSAHWYLTCSRQGQALTGTDCLDFTAVPDTHSAPARWIGFVPLVVLWLAATAILIACLVLRARASARHYPDGA